MALVITKQESTFFLVCFILLFSAHSYAIFLSFVGLFAFFLLKRKEIYFVWSILAPRITGDAPIVEYLLELAREEGPGNKELNDLFRLDVPFMAPIFFVFKPSYIKRILALEPDNFPSNGYQGVMVKITANSGKNILLNEGPPSPHWAQYREITSPINKDRFGESSLLSKLFDQTWKTTQELTHRFDAMRDRDLDLFFELYPYMIPAHNRALFGEEVAKKFQYGELSKEMYDVITETGKQLKFPMTSPKNERILLEQTDRITKAVVHMAKDATSPFMKSWLEALRNGQLTEEEFKSNIMVFEYAQAPLHVAFWVLYLLALHPEEEKKVMHEIASVLSQGPMTHSRLGEFKYLARVLTETIRLYPGVGLMQVRFPKTNTMLGSHFVPEGSYIMLCNYIIHRNATYWPNPDDFDPSREGLDLSHSGETLTHIPFGYGPRQCQGQFFAQDFVKVAVISLMQHHKLTLSPGQKSVYPTEIGFLRPAKPVYFRFSERVMPVPPPVPITPSAEKTPSKQSSSQQRLNVPQQRPTLTGPVSPSSSYSLSVSSEIAPRPTSASKKGPPPMLSRSSKMNNLSSQSQIFKESFISMGKLKKNNKDLLVVFGSQSGTARGFASRIVNMADLCKISATLSSFADLDPAVIPQYKAVVVATSTYGDGGPPENAEKFNYWLEQEHPAGSWSGVKYAVLSLGSTMYPYPFKFGTFVSKRFAQLGAKALLQDEKIDEIKYNQQEVFTNWSLRLFEALSQDGTEERTLVARNRLLGFQSFDFNLLNAPFKLSFTNKTIKNEPRLIYPENVILTTVERNEQVNSDPNNQIYSLELKYKEGSLSYQAGDNVAVYAANINSLVSKLVTRLNYQPDLVFNVEEKAISSPVELSCDLGKNKCTLEIALQYFYDITNVTTSTMLQFLAMNCNDTGDQKILLSYSSNYRSFLRLQYSVLDVLELFPSIQLVSKDVKKNEENLAVFLGLLGPIRPRYYSIASAPDTSANTLRIVYKAVRYSTKEGQEKHGFCSSFLKAKAKEENVAISISKSKFKLPENDEVPIVMVGAGSGISPYFGFIEQRNYNKEKGGKLGKGILIHGCRSEADFANKAKVDGALSSGLLSEVWPAYSRAETPEHVQNVIEKHGEALWEALNKEEGIVYICGDVGVGVKVREALIKLAQKHGNLSYFKANYWLNQLSNSKRLRHDEWGISTHSGTNVIRAARLRLWRKSIIAAFAFMVHKKAAPSV